jgi:hypothetical protein
MPPAPPPPTQAGGVNLPRVDSVTPPSPEQLRHAAVALIGRGIEADTPISDTDLAWGRDIAEALGLIPVLSARYRDPVSRGWKTRDMTQPAEPVKTGRGLPPWECEGQTTIDELLPGDEDQDEEDPLCLDC